MYFKSENYRIDLFYVCFQMKTRLKKNYLGQADPDCSNIQV